VKVCALLQKPSRARVEVPIAYKGFKIPDSFVVGYGLDCGTAASGARPTSAS